MLEAGSSSSVIDLHDSESQVPWTFRDAWIGFGLFFAMLVGLGIAGAFLENQGLISVWLLIYQPLQVIPVLIIVRMRGATLADLGFRTARPNVLAIGCGLIVLAMGVGFVNNIVMELLKVPIQAQRFLGIVDELGNPAAFLVAGILVAPIFEEIVFRGFLFPGLRKKLGWEKAALLSSALFALCHFQLAAFIPTFLLGLAFAYLYQRSASVWPGIILHTLINSFSLCLLVTMAPYLGSMGI